MNYDSFLILLKRGYNLINRKVGYACDPDAAIKKRLKAPHVAQSGRESRFASPGDPIPTRLAYDDAQKTSKTDEEIFAVGVRDAAYCFDYRLHPMN